MNISYILEEKRKKYIPENSRTEEKLPVLLGVQAGGPETVEYPLEWEKVDDEMAHSGIHSIYKIRGDSMEPRFCDGDRVIVKKEDEYRTGDIVLVSVGGALTIKKLKKTPAGMELIPLNWKYNVQRYKQNDLEFKNAQIIGRVTELRGNV